MKNQKIKLKFRRIKINCFEDLFFIKIVYSLINFFQPIEI